MQAEDRPPAESEPEKKRKKVENADQAETPEHVEVITKEMLAETKYFIRSG